MFIPSPYLLYSSSAHWHSRAYSKVVRFEARPERIGWNALYLREEFGRESEAEGDDEAIHAPLTLNAAYHIRQPR